MPSETMPPPGRVSDALFPVRRPAPKAVKHRTPIKRTAPPKRRNRKRHTKEWLRAYHSEERVEWVKRQRCVGCGGGPCENAHTESGGKSRKANYDTIAPLCAVLFFNGKPGCHPRYDQHLPPFDNETTREKIRALAADTERRWQEEAA